MNFTIIRNDITNMETDAIVCPTDADLVIGGGCEADIYNAAGREELESYVEKKLACLPYGESHLAYLPIGDAFITPGFKLKAKYIIHTVTPFYGEDKAEVKEERLRLCYRNSLKRAAENGIKSIAFPLLGSGTKGFPVGLGVQIATEEIEGFLKENDMKVYLDVYGSEATRYVRQIEVNMLEMIDDAVIEEKERKACENAEECFRDRLSEKILCMVITEAKDS